MIKTTLPLAFAALSLSAPAFAHDPLPPGIWTNTEDVYFAGEEDREKAPDVMIEAGADGQWRYIDAFGKAQSEWSNEAIPGLSRREGGSTWQIGDSEIRQARHFSCWVSTRKYASKEDGSEDWTWSNGHDLFDQGGRVFVPGNGEAPDVTVRLRNVTWAKGSRNRPAFVLYMHKGDPVRAVSYSWASPDAELIGINLRWVQASCGIVDAPSEKVSLAQ